MTDRPSTDPVPRIPWGEAIRPGVVAMVTAVVVNVVIVVIGRATEADLAVTQGGERFVVGVPQVISMTIGSIVVGTVGLALSGRWGARGWNLVAAVGLGIGVLTTALPLLADAEVSTRLTLAVMHLAVGAAFFLAVRRALPGLTPHP